MGLSPAWQCRLSSFLLRLVNSLAVVLLPSTARHQSAGNTSGIADGISMSFRYSLYLGIFCIGVFTVFGETLGL